MDLYFLETFSFCTLILPGCSWKCPLCTASKDAPQVAQPFQSDILCAVVDRVHCHFEGQNRHHSGKKNTVFSSAWGLWSPRTPFSQSSSSTSGFSSSALSTWEPFPTDFSRFISASSTVLNSAKAGSLRKSTSGFPLSRTNHIMPHTML